MNPLPWGDTTNKSPPSPGDDPIIIMEGGHCDTSKATVFFDEPIVLVQQVCIERGFCGEVVLIDHPSNKSRNGSAAAEGIKLPYTQGQSSSGSAISPRNVPEKTNFMVSIAYSPSIPVRLWAL